MSGSLFYPKENKLLWAIKEKKKMEQNVREMAEVKKNQRLWMKCATNTSIMLK